MIDFFALETVRPYIIELVIVKEETPSLSNKYLPSVWFLTYNLSCVFLHARVSLRAFVSVSQFLSLTVSLRVVPCVCFNTCRFLDALLPMRARVKIFGKTCYEKALANRQITKTYTKTGLHKERLTTIFTPLYVRICTLCSQNFPYNTRILFYKNV